MADSHSSSASAKTPQPIAWAVMEGAALRGIYTEESMAEYVREANVFDGRSRYRVEPLYGASSLAELVADSQRLDVAQKHYVGADFDHPEYRDRTVVLIALPKGIRVGGKLRKALDTARSLPETTDNG